MDFALAGLGVFVGWIVLVVASDLFGLMRVASAPFARIQSGFLIFAIVGAIGCGYAYLQERHHQPPCAPGNQRR